MTMTQLIAKKIQKSDAAQSNGAYAKALVSYITNPDAEPSPDKATQGHAEKCVHCEMLGFSSDTLTPKEAAQEIGTLCRTVEDSGNKDLLSHWTIAWKGPSPTQDEIMGAARDLLSDMGYGPDHSAIIGIHTDTDHTHVHIAACRVSTADGSILKEGQGWWKLEAQRFCARSAEKYGWETPEGCKFVPTGETEKVQQVNKFTGEVSERTRPAVKKASKEKTDAAPALRDRAMWAELKTGLRSHLGALQDTMHGLKNKITDKLKWGDTHRLLAENGVEMALQDHGGRQGLSYTMDGEHWEKAGSVGKEFSLENMEKQLGGKRYRHARESVREIAESARKEMINMPTPTAEAKTPLSREQVQALRLIPIDEVRAKLGVEPTDSKKIRKIRNGLDVVIHEKGQTYDQAVQTLAEAFPAVVSGNDLINTVPTESYAARLAGSGLPESLHRTAQDTMKQIDAFGCERFHVYASGEGAGYTSRKKYPEGMTQQDLFKELPQLARMNIEHNASIFFAPVHEERKISIPVDDVKTELLEKHRPSLVFATSDRSKQAHYVIEKKYPDKFYDWLTQRVNLEYGDPKILKAEHDTRLAGFTNRKQQKIDGTEGYPFAKIEQHTPLRCMSFEQFVDEQFIVFKQDQERQQQAALSKKSTTAQRQQVDIENIVAVLQHQKNAEAWKGEKHGANEYIQLQYVHVPAELAAEASSYQGAIRQQYRNNLDAKRADNMIAKHMYALGADRDQVYSWLSDKMTQDKDNKTGRDREARRTAVNLFPNSILKPVSSSDTHKELMENKRAENTMSNWERLQMNAGNSTPVPVPGNRDKALAADAAVIKAAEEAKVKAAAEAKAKAEEEQRQRQRQKQQEQTQLRKEQAKLRKWQAAASKVGAGSGVSSSPSHSGQSSGPSSSHGPRM